jgi:hypothetical protein
LTQFNLDIWSCYVATRDQNRELIVDLDFDAQLYESQIDMTSAQRKDMPRGWLQELYARIACRFIKDLSLRPDRKPDIYLKRNHLLLRSTNNLVDRDMSEVQDGSLLLPRGMIDTIKNNFIDLYGQEWAARIEREKSAALATLVADPELRGLIVTIVFPHTGHVHVRIEAKNQVGTIATITNALFENGFNVLQAYTRNLHAAERSLTDLLLHLRPEIKPLLDDLELRRFVRRTLQGRALKKLNCIAKFPSPRGNGRITTQAKKDKA